MFSAEEQRTWWRGSPPSRRSRSRTRACTRSARGPRRRCSARCCHRTCPRSRAWSWPRATAPRGEGNEVGGDFYDVFPQADGSWALVVGDVCGKGPEAAAVTALARYTLRAHAVAGLRPSYQLARLNDALLRQRAPGFVTVALARLELTPGGARVEVAIAGHPADPLALRGGRAVRRDRHAAGDRRAPRAAGGGRRAQRRRPAGVLHRWRERGGGATAPAERRSISPALVAERAAAGPAAVVEHLERTAVEIADGAPRDDIACLAFQVTPPRRRLRALPGDPARRPRRRHALAPVSGELGERAAQDCACWPPSWWPTPCATPASRAARSRCSCASRATSCTSACWTRAPASRRPRARSTGPRGRRRLGAVPGRPVRAALGERSWRAPPRVARSWSVTMPPR